MAFKFSNTSSQLMEGVHPRLVKVAERALAYGILDILVIGPYGGLRTEDMQRKLVQRGASQTMHSKHRVQADGYGHALDLGPYPLDWNNLDELGFVDVAQLIRLAAIEERVLLTWGAVWDRRLNDLGPGLEAEVDAYVQRRRSVGKNAFLDYPHFEIAGFL